MQNIISITTNKNKAKEILPIIPKTFTVKTAADFPLIDMNMIKENHMLGTPAAIAEDKARQFAELFNEAYPTHMPPLILANDSGFFIDELGGWPGIYTGTLGKNQKDAGKYFLDTFNQIADNKANRKCHLISATAIYDVAYDRMYTSTYTLDGKLADSVHPYKNGAYSAHNVFISDEDENNKVFSEYTLEERINGSQISRSTYDAMWKYLSSLKNRFMIIKVQLKPDYRNDENMDIFRDTIRSLNKEMPFFFKFKKKNYTCFISIRQTADGNNLYELLAQLLDRSANFGGGFDNPLPYEISIYWSAEPMRG